MPNGQLNLAHSYRALGNYQKAEQAYLQALKLDGKSLPAHLNFADFYRTQGREIQGMELLLRARDLYPDSPMAYFSLGLAQIRASQGDKALTNLQQASLLAPDNSRFAYAYALSLNAQGSGAEAVKVLSRALNPAAPDRDLLFALVTISRDLGRQTQARDFADKLVIAFPEDSAAINLRRSLH
jgi:Tfp pilus assembly protein PilF